VCRAEENTPQAQDLPDAKRSPTQQHDEFLSAESAGEALSLEKSVQPVSARPSAEPQPQNVADDKDKKDEAPKPDGKDKDAKADSKDAKVEKKDAKEEPKKELTAEEKAAADKKAAEAAKAEAEAAKVPPPPEPTAEQIAKRREDAQKYMSLGEKFFSFPVTGSLYTRYRLRSGPSDKDQDIYQFLSMDVGDKERNMATGHVDTRMSADLAGKAGKKADLFTELVDTYDNHAVNARLYSAYVDFNKIPEVEVLRAGRQFSYDTPEILQFDGVRLDTKPLLCRNDLKFSFYGGHAVHEFESSQNGDDLYGAAVEARPWQSARMRMDWTHSDDLLEFKHSLPPEQLVVKTEHTTRQDDLFSWSMWQTIRNPNIRLYGRFSVLDGEARDALARIVYDKPDWQLQVSSTYRAWFEKRDLQATEFDTYFQTLRGQEPYQNGNLIVSKGWNDYFWMEGGAVVRRLTHPDEQKAFNRDFERYYFTGQIRDLPIKGLVYSLTAARWEGEGRAPDSTQFGGDITYSWKKEFQSSIGTDYALYKYDLFTNTERDEVRTWYAKQRWRPNRWACLDVQYEHEKSRGNDYDTLSVTFRFTF
jgi:hypothetical protein